MLLRRSSPIITLKQQLTKQHNPHFLSRVDSYRLKVSRKGRMTMQCLQTLICVSIISCLAKAERSSIEPLSDSLAAPSSHHRSFDLDVGADASIGSTAMTKLSPLNFRAPPDCDEETQHRYSTLVCWLWELQLAIPDQQISKGFFSVSIHDMICSQIQVNSTESNYIPGKDGHGDDDGNDDDKGEHDETTDPMLSVEVNGISIQCEGMYKAALVGGTVTVLVNNSPDHEALHIQTSIQSTVLQNNTSNSLSHSSSPTTSSQGTGNGGMGNGGEPKLEAPSGATVTACSTNLQVQDISFSGSMSAKLVELFSKSIASHVTSELNAQICPKVTEAVGVNLTEALIKLDSFLDHLIYNDYDEDNNGADGGDYGKGSLGSTFTGGSSLDVVSSRRLSDGDNRTDLIQWDELPQLQFVWEQTSNFISTHLHEGILLDIMDRIGWPVSNDSAQGCSSDCGYFFRGVNGFIKNITNDGEWTIHIDRELDIEVKKIGNMTINLQNVTVGGLDGLTRLEILPEAPRDVAAHISMDYLSLHICADLKVFPAPGGIFRDKPLEESFSVFLNTSHLALDLPMDLGIIRERLHETTIADLNDPEYGGWAKTILRTLSHVILGDVESTITVDRFNIVPQRSADDLEKSLDVLLDNVITLVLREYEELVSEMIQAGIRGPFIRAINSAVSKIIQNATHWDITDDFIKDESIDYFRFNESATLTYLHDFFLSESFANQVNDYIACISLFLEENPLRPRAELSTSNGIAARINDFSFQGISMTLIDLFNGVDESHLAFGLNVNADNTTENISSMINFDFDYPEEELHAAVTLNASMHELGGKFGSKILFNLSEYQKLNLYDLITDLTSMTKPFSTLSGVYDFSAYINELNMGINISLTENKSVRPVLFESTLDDGFGDIVTAYLMSFTKLTQNALNGIKQIYSGPNSCGDEESATGADGIPPIKRITCVLLLFLCLNVYFFVKLPSNNRARNEVTDHLRSETSGPYKETTSLIFHKKISHALRFLIPLAIIATIIIFMVSNFSVGAWVDIKISRPDGSTLLMIPAVTTFSLAKTVRDMYHAQVYTLMTLVLVFSGIWPYVKLLMMLLSWISSESIMTFETKEWVLIALDALGKYSLVDSFVLVLMLVSFKFRIDFPGILSIDSYVIPAFGFYLFLLATVLSLIVGHGLTFLHRFTKLKPVAEHSNHRQALCNHEFHFIDSIGGVGFARLSPITHKCWALATIMCTAFLCVGSTNKSFTFDFEGLLGDILGDNRSTSYSLWTLGTTLPLSVEDPKNIGILLIQITFFFFTLVMPFVCLFTITILYYMPMTLKKQQLVFTLAEIANAWSAIEVFLLSVLASMLELSQFAAFMVGDHCDFLKTRFFEDLFQGQDTCFSVESRISFGVIYLFLGVALYNLIVFLGLRLAHDALEERMLQEGGGNISLTEGSTHEHSTMISKIIRWKITKLFISTNNSQ